MNKKQAESTSKYIYDISKVIFTFAILGNVLAWDKFNIITFILGILLAVLTFVWAYLIDGKEGFENV